ncbi:MAG: hypothetical protein HFH93_07665 [Lachnospiraceae bacterium]|nr:hypothetical protein [Lachnospiraceae bacterium]
MRAKWRKIIWAILAVQLLLLHLLFLDRAYLLGHLIYRVVRHFGLPVFLYTGWKQLAVLGWLATAGVVLLVRYGKYVKFRRWCIGQIYMVQEESVRESLRQAVQETGLGKGASLYRAEGIREPFVIGFARPILLLPEREFRPGVLKFIFLHECCHIRQRDTLYKLFWLLMRSLLWFQPLIYLLAALGSRDVEVACDEAVVEGRDMAERKEYGSALLECLRQGRERGRNDSAYFYHGKRLLKARISAIMKEDRKWDVLAYVGIGVLLLDLGLNLYRVGDVLYGHVQADREEPLTSIYEGYDLPDCFTQSVAYKMAEMEPVGEDAYRQERLAEDGYDRKEYARLPYAAEGPWQVRLEDVNHYSEAVGLLVQRYLSYYIDWKWASERDWETHSEFRRFETVHQRLLAGDKQECVYELAFRYPLSNQEAFPEELAQRARFGRIVYEDGMFCYAYFDWTVRMRMVKDYVFELEGIAETQQVLEAFRERYGQEVFSDVPVLDLAEEAAGPGNGDFPGDGLQAAGAASGGEETETYRTEVREDALWVCGGDGVYREVPVSMEMLLARGDEMDGRLTSLPAESCQVDARKQIFAYGGGEWTPLAVVYYDEETGDFRESVVEAKAGGSRRIFVDFPENGREGFLISTGGRVVWQESSTLFRTGDGGKTWQKVRAAGPDIHSLTLDADFIDNQVGFITIRSSDEPDIWRTADGGEHWEKLELPHVPEGYCTVYAPELQGEALALYVGMEDYSEYGGKKAKYESRDQGRTWEYKGFVIRK